jgi:hypothetical protein
MQLYLNKVFETYKTRAGKEKCRNMALGRTLMKFIIQAGSNENIEQLHDWLKEYSRLWLVEFEKLVVKR